MRVIAFLFAFSAAAAADVRLTEIMADPVGSEFRNEFIELVNIGHESVDLEGWAIADGASADVLVFESTSLIAPGERVLIVDPDYEAGTRPYGAFSSDIVATVTDRSFGSAGLANGRPETVYLVDAAGDTVDAVLYEVGAEGHSWEWAESSPDDEAWRLSKWAGGTPGRVNSTSRQDIDLSLTFRAQPDSVAAAQESKPLFLAVTNTGNRPVDDALVSVTGLDIDLRKAIGRIESGATIEVEFVLSGASGAARYHAARVVADGDGDPTNNMLEWEVRYGAEHRTIVVSEVMADADLEWVELYNRSDATVQMAGWSLVDGAGRNGLIPSLEIEPGQLVVLSDAAGDTPADWYPVSPWPSLNNGGDSITLLDLVGTQVDYVVYEGVERNRSLERIDPDGDSLDPDNWLTNGLDQGGTPGSANRAALSHADTVILAAYPTDEGARIKAEFTEFRTYVDLEVYDRVGRLRRSLLKGVEVGSLLDLLWDGKDNSGRPLRPGVYVVALSHSGSDGATYRERTVIHLTKGL